MVQSNITELAKQIINEFEKQQIMNQHTLTLALTSAKLESEIEKYELTKEHCKNITILNSRILSLELELFYLKKKINDIILK